MPKTARTPKAAVVAEEEAIQEESTELDVQAMIDSMTLEKVALDQLVESEENPRDHTPEQIELLIRSMGYYGYTAPILAQRGTNKILAGHGRYRAAKIKGLTTLPTIFLTLSTRQAKAYRIADNAITERSEWDFTKLHDLLDELKIEGFDLDMTGLDESLTDALLPEDTVVEGKEYAEDVAEGVTTNVRFKIMIEENQADELEAALTRALKKFPDATIDRVQ